MKLWFSKRRLCLLMLTFSQLHLMFHLSMTICIDNIVSFERCYQVVCVSNKFLLVNNFLNECHIIYKAIGVPIFKPPDFSYFTLFYVLLWTLIVQNMNLSGFFGASLHDCHNINNASSNISHTFTFIHCHFTDGFISLLFIHVFTVH